MGVVNKKYARELAIKYAQEVVKVIKPTAIVLLGSYINGTPNEDSDIEPHLLDETQDKSGFVKHVFTTGEILYRAA
jgi:predicted nucleotidyltransferase